MEERDYLYLKGTEELGDIIEILKDFKGDEIVLVVPAGAKALSHPVNVDLLKKEFAKKKKKIYFSTEDKKISDLLKAAGFHVFLEEYENAEELHKLVTDIVVPSKTKPQIRKTEVSQKSSQKKPKLPFIKIIWLIAAVVLLGGIAAFGMDQFTSKAKITITLKSESRDFDEIVELKPQAISNDLANQILKGEKIDLIKTHTVIIPATGAGRGGNRTKGEITLNNSASNSLSLVAGTRFQSSDGKIYRATSRVYVPVKEEGGKVNVEVVADESGEKYNIEAGAEFKIPGLLGTNWESKIKATAENGLSGGGSGETKTASVDDLIGGKVKLEKELKEIILQEIKAKYSDYVFPAEAGSVNISAVDISHKAGQQTDKISFSGKSEFKTIGVKKDNLVNFTKDLIANKSLKEKADVRISELNIENLRIMEADAKLSFMKVQVSGKVKIKGNIDSKIIAQQLTGKNLEDVQGILKNNSVIENAEASIWPFWNNQLPANSDKIEISVK